MFRFPLAGLLLSLATLTALPSLAHADDIRRVNTTLDGLLYNPTDGKLYGGIVGGGDINSIIPIDPQTATLGTPVALGSLPQEMVISSDGHYIDTVLYGGTQVRQFDTTTQPLGVQYGLGHDYSDLYAEDICAIPGSPGSVVISRANSGLSPRHKDIVIYDKGVQRVTTNRAAGANYIEVNETGTRLYGYFAEVSSFDFVRWDLGANGLSNGTVIHPFANFSLNFKYGAGRGYAATSYSPNGTVFDPESGAILGNYSSQSLGMTLPDGPTGKLFTSSQSGTDVTIKVQDLKTLATLGTILVPNVSGTPNRLVRWGTTGLAFHSANQVILVRNSLVQTLQPTISSVSPVQGRVGDSVVITGQELGTAQSVQFGGVDATFHVDSNTQITATVPVGATSGPLSVTTQGKTAQTPFTVLMPTISVGDASVTEGDSGTTSLDFTIRLSYPSTDTVSCDFTTLDATATAGSDYTALTRNVTFAPGETSKTISVTVQGDTTYEPDETLRVRLTNVSGATTTAQAPLLRNSANGHFYELVSANLNWEAAKAAAASRNYWGVAGHLVTIASADEEAFVNNNFSGITFWLGGVQAPGSTEPAGGFGWITGEPFNYTDWNSGEPNNANGGEDTIQRNNFNKWNDVARTVGASQYLVEYDTAPDAQAPRLEATGTIRNDDSLPTLSIANTQVIEGNSGNTNADFAVTLSNPSSQPVTANYTTVDDTATAGSDYTAVSGTLTFAPGETTKTISVPVDGDTADEPNETFRVRLSNIVGAQTASSLPHNNSNGHFYEMMSSNLNWDDARAAAMTRSYLGVAGHLATITSANEEAFIVSNFSSTPYFWIGGIQAPGSTEPAGGFSWVTGEPFNYTDWDSGEPSNLNGNEDAIQFNSSHKWNDVSRLWLVSNYLIEYDTTNPSTEAVGTILDDDSIPTISIGDTQVTEGNTGITSADFSVTLNHPSSEPITIEYATTDGTAMAGSDYTATDGTLTFAPGETTKTVSVPVQGDVIDENDETFTVALSNPANATLANNSAVGTIIDDDTAILTVDNPSMTEGDSGTLPLNFTLRLSTPSDRPITISYQTIDSTDPSVNGAATAGVDYQPVSATTFTFAPGQTSKTVTVRIIGDKEQETNEQVGLLVMDANDSTDTVEGVGTIIDNDGAPTISINNVSANEGTGDSGGQAVFTVKLSAPTFQQVGVNFTTASGGEFGTATPGLDYTNTSGSLTFAPGETSKTLVIPLVGDTLDEPNETFSLLLSNPSNASVAKTQGTATIVDDDNAPSLSFAPTPVSIPERNSGTNQMSFIVRLSAPSGRPVQFTYQTFNAPQAPATAGEDYIPVSPQVATIAPGLTSARVTVTVKGDTMYEQDEHIGLRLSNAVNATIAAGQNTNIGTIVNDDPAPTISINSVATTEGNSGMKNLVFTVKLSAASSITTKVRYATANGTALAGSDYSATGGTLTFAPGETTQTIAVPIKGDTLPESDEQFQVVLSAPVGATLNENKSVGTGTIKNDDSSKATGTTPSAGSS